jgi:hypothetical protein
VYLRKRFDLVCFAELADWLARSPGRLGRDEDRRDESLTELRDDTLAGAFGPIDKLWVVNLTDAGQAAAKFPFRLSAGQVRWFTERGIEFAAVLWIPRSLAVRWFDARGFNLAPWFAAPSKIMEPRSAKAAPPSESESALMTPAAAPRHKKLGPKLRATIEALDAIYNDGIPPTLTPGPAQRAANRWFQKTKKLPPSATWDTTKRALRHIRARSSAK